MTGTNIIQRQILAVCWQSRQPWHLTFTFLCLAPAHSPAMPHTKSQHSFCTLADLYDAQDTFQLVRMCMWLNKVGVIDRKLIEKSIYQVVFRILAKNDQITTKYLNQISLESQRCKIQRRQCWATDSKPGCQSWKSAREAPDKHFPLTSCLDHLELWLDHICYSTCQTQSSLGVYCDSDQLNYTKSHVIQHIQRERQHSQQHQWGLHWRGRRC